MDSWKENEFDHFLSIPSSVKSKNLHKNDFHVFVKKQSKAMSRVLVWLRWQLEIVQFLNVRIENVGLDCYCKSAKRKLRILAD